ncbi:hypothetical protein D3C76_1732870 [compost metagenome]
MAVEQSDLGVDRLFQPTPTDHAMAEGLEVQRRVGQRATDLALRQVAQQGQGDGLQPIDQLLERLAQGVKAWVVAGALAGGRDQAN